MMEINHRLLDIEEILILSVNCVLFEPEEALLIFSDTDLNANTAFFLFDENDNELFPLNPY